MWVRSVSILMARHLKLTGGAAFDGYGGVPYTAFTLGALPLAGAGDLVGFAGAL